MSETQAVDSAEYDAQIEECLAYAVAEGDIVNFRLLFMPASPFREDSPEDASTSKYDYLFPENKDSEIYQRALALVQENEIISFVHEQLKRKGPPQLPWQLVLMLGDNALRLGKYTAAAQAYELLRVRRRIQELFMDQGDDCLKKGNSAGAVQGYLIALGLQYDYSAFPEPLPAVPDYHERAPALHSVYPIDSKQILALQEDSTLCKVAYNYLFPYAEFTGRLDALSLEERVAFTAALIRGLDPDWDSFAALYRNCLEQSDKQRSAFEKINAYSMEVIDMLRDDPFDTETLAELKAIPQRLAETDTPDQEWWHYVKIMATHHPGSALFIARQRLTATHEIVIPRVNAHSELAKALGLII